MSDSIFARLKKLENSIKPIRKLVFAYKESDCEVNSEDVVYILLTIPSKT
jgi:hypothetical protein